jgi:hypothetical protein
MLDHQLHCLTLAQAKPGTDQHRCRKWQADPALKKRRSLILSKPGSIDLRGEAGGHVERA